MWRASEETVWGRPENITELGQQLAHPDFDWHPYQLQCLAITLDGGNLLLVNATGSGKSALIYLPVLARPDKLVFALEPTNMLEEDLVRLNMCCQLGTSFSH
jgi:hypothetical protein